MSISELKLKIFNHCKDSVLIEDFIDRKQRYLGFGAIFYANEKDVNYSNTMQIEITSTTRIGQEDCLVFVMQQHYNGDLRLKALGVFDITSIVSLKKFLKFISINHPDMQA